MKFKLQSQEKKLDELFSLVEKIEEEEVKALLSKLLCVRTSGLIESAVKNLINEYIVGTSPKPVQDFVNKKMKNATNLRYEKLLEILAMYSIKWSESFADRINDEQRAALNSIVSNRNNIAHGENDSISFIIMKDYYKQAKVVIDTLKEIIKK